MTDRKLIFIMGVLLLMVLFTVASNADECATSSNNLKALKAVVTEVRANELVSLSVERPYIMVTAAQKAFYDFNGYLPAERGTHD